jgi:alanine dehydrogenase
MIRLDEADVTARLAALDLPALMRSVLIAVARGEAGNPPRAAFTTPSGTWFGAMPAWSAGEGGALGAKLVVAIPGNAARGLPTHRAVVVLLDPATGEPSAWIEAEALTRARTAAVSVVATRALARRPRGVHAILGAGAQGQAHLDAFARAGLAERLVVWSRDRARSEDLAHNARSRGIEVWIASDADDAVRGADVITTCTAAAAPLFEARSIAADAHVNAVGACVAHKRELPAALIGASSLVVDDIAAAHQEAGDVILAVAERAASWDGVISLGEVLADLTTPRAGRMTVFESLGLGVEDVAAAAAIVAY